MRILGALVQASKWLLVAFLVLFVGLTLALTVVCHDFLKALQDVLALALTLSSPTDVLRGTGWFLVLWGWLIAILGWLLVPLLVGAIFDVGVQMKEAESGFRFMYYQVGRKRGLEGADLETFVTTMMNYTRKRLEEGRPR